MNEATLSGIQMSRRAGTHICTDCFIFLMVFWHPKLLTLSLAHQTHKLISVQWMKLDLKGAWTICPSIINFVLPFSTFDLPPKILYYCNTIMQNSTKRHKKSRYMHAV